MYGRAGDFVRPTAGNVTASLSLADINSNPHSPHFMQVDLAHLYTPATGSVPGEP